MRPMTEIAQDTEKRQLMPPRMAGTQLPREVPAPDAVETASLPGRRDLGTTAGKAR